MIFSKMSNREFFYRLIRRFRIFKVIYRFCLSKKLKDNRSFSHLNKKYLSFSSAEKRIFHGLTSRLFFKRKAPKNLSVVWETNFNRRPFYVPLSTEKLSSDWHTAVSVDGSDNEVKSFYEKGNWGIIINN